MPSKLDFSAPPSLLDNGFSYSWLKWFETIFNRVGSGPFKVRGYSRTSLPEADEWGDITVTRQEFSSIIFVYNATQGASLAYSDGTNWLSVIDGLAV